jgi:hypothetical protein
MVSHLPVLGHKGSWILSERIGVDEVRHGRIGSGIPAKPFGQNDFAPARFGKAVRINMAVRLHYAEVLMLGES